MVSSTRPGAAATHASIVSRSHFALAAGEAPSSQLWALAALLRCEAETPSADLRGWHSSTLGAQPVQLRCGDHEQTVYIRYQDNHAELIVSENSHRIATLAPGLATIDGVQQRYRMCQDGKQSWLQWQGHVESCRSLELVMQRHVIIA